MKYALLFPGQGAQAVGMGKALADSFAQARAVFEQADKILGFSLSNLCWVGPAEELTRTKNCQPALYVTSMAALAALGSELGVRGSELKPSAGAGLSLGEYTALAAAGSFTFEDGLQLVSLRGQAMEEAASVSSGTMASILGLEEEALAKVCKETGAQIANLNAPGQIVISGPKDAVEKASEGAKAAGAKRVIPLWVGGAFHSRLMEPAAAKLREALAATDAKNPNYPVASNVTGHFHAGPQEIRRLLAEQLTHPVRWEMCAKRIIIEEGTRTFLEVGAGTVLKGLLRKIDPAANVLPVGTPQEVQAAAAALLS